MKRVKIGWTAATLQEVVETNGSDLCHDKGHEWCVKERCSMYFKAAIRNVSANAGRCGIQ